MNNIINSFNLLNFKYLKRFQFSKMHGIMFAVIPLYAKFQAITGVPKYGSTRQNDKVFELMKDLNIWPFCLPVDLSVCLTGRLNFLEDSITGKFFVS